MSIEAFLHGAYLAEDALGLAALRGVARNHGIPGLDARHALTHRLDYCPGLVAQDAREQALRILPTQRVDVCSSIELKVACTWDRLYISCLMVAQV
jgi:hypothetical protein